MQKFRDDVTRMRTAEIGNFQLLKIEQEGHHGALGKPFHFEFSNSNTSVIPAYFKKPFWLMIDNNGPYPQ